MSDDIIDSLTTCKRCGRPIPQGTDCPLCAKAKRKPVKKTRARSDRTPRSRIKSALRRLSMRCREKSEALKRSGYSCVRCGIKQSKAAGREVRIEVHHIDPVSENDWMNRITDEILEHLLPPPERWMPLCEDCHEREHAELAAQAEEKDSTDA